ncbi:MAG: hypothetical protein ACYDEJ_09355 [Desulfitobacteriaceae bacterium]
MIKKIILVAFALLIFRNATALAHTAAVDNTGPNKYKSVRLTPEIYNQANSDLSDILVKDQNGDSVPYFINTGYKMTYNSGNNYPMSLINSYLKDDAFFFDYQVTSLPDRDIISTSIELATENTNFAKNIEVFGSYDNLHWEKIQDDSVYSVDSKKKLTIDFVKPQKYTYFRLKLANNLEKITFTKVNLIYNASTFEESYFIETLRPKFQVEQKDKKTYIKLEGLKNLKLTDITVLSDSVFKRTVSTPFGDEEIYNLSFKDSAYLDTTITLNWKMPLDDIFFLAIENNDDKPININGLIVRYYADEIVFEGKGSNSFQIYFAKDDNKKAPVYDISSYKQEILKEKIDNLAIRNIEFDTSQETKQSDYKFIFNIVIIITAILLAVIILLKLRKR